MNTAFASALVRAAPKVPADIINTGNRFNVYRNNYLTGLISTFSARFPVTCQLVGTEYFEAMAHSYVRETPPSSPLLDHYGEDFPGFLEMGSPLDPPAYLPDMARVEWARSVAAIADHKPALQIANREDLERAFDVRFQLIPGGMVIASAHPVGTIWSHHQTDPVKPITDWTPETVAIWWFGGQVRQETLSSDSVAMLEALAGGTSFLHILNEAKSEAQAVRLISTFTSFTHTGLLVPTEETTEQHDHEF